MRRRPYQVILFDEIEKAHPEVWNTLLQVLEDGRLTDGQGHTVDFRNTVIIMTSNIGTEFAQNGGTLGFQTPARTTKKITLEKEYEEIEESLKRTFRPEFLNRIDEVIIFHVLEPRPDQVDRRSANEGNRRPAQRTRDRHRTDGRGPRVVGEEGFDPQFGARPLRRTLQRKVESPLSRKLLSGEFKSGDFVIVDADEKEGIVFRKKENGPVEQGAIMEAPKTPGDRITGPEFLSEIPNQTPVTDAWRFFMFQKHYSTRLGTRPKQEAQ